MARRGVQYQPNGRSEDRPVAPRSVPRWWRGPDPDPVVVGRLYVQEGRTETEIAVLLSISRDRVAAVLRNAGIPRRNTRKDCPVDPDTLRALVKAGGTVAAVARNHGCPMPQRRGGSPRPACSARIPGSIRGCSVELRTATIDG